MSREQHQLSFSREKKSCHQDRMSTQAQDSLTERMLRATGDSIAGHGTITKPQKEGGMVLLKKIPSRCFIGDSCSGSVPSNTAHQDADSYTVTVSQVIYERSLVALTGAPSTPYSHRGTKQC